MLKDNYLKGYHQIGGILIVKGDYQYDYLHNPDINKPIEQIYADLDAFTLELFDEEECGKYSTDLFVALPPLYYEGKFIKGLVFTQAADVLIKLHPRIKELFNVAAYSMWCAIPWSFNADAYFVCYKNKQREDWFKKTHPDKADKILVPVQDGDFNNEYIMAPYYGQVKDLDLLCVSRLSAVKNIPFIAKGLKAYRKKYPDEKIKMTLIVGKNFEKNYNGLDDHERGQLREVEEILGNVEDYIDLVPQINYYELPQYYARSKAFILGSLIEGKNRAINEAMSCNTPVICFKQFNQYSRGDDRAFPEGAGLYANFDEEDLADTIHKVLKHQGDFKPRYYYLKNNGRKNFLSRCIDHIPYYKNAIPEYEPGNHHNNICLDIACKELYDISLNEFLYSKKIEISWVQGLPSITSTINSFFERWNLPD